jgi:hypothetical protein
MSAKAVPEIFSPSPQGFIVTGFRLFQSGGTVMLLQKVKTHKKYSAFVSA